MITQDDNSNIEIRRRITAANKCYFQQIISRSTKLHHYKTLVQPILHYRSECRMTISKATSYFSKKNSLSCFKSCRRMEVTHYPRAIQWFWRWLYCASNETRRLRYVGLIVRKADGEMSKILLTANLWNKEKRDTSWELETGWHWHKTMIVEGNGWRR